MHKCKANMHRFRQRCKSSLGHLFVLWPIKRLIACPSSPHIHTMKTLNRLANLFKLWRNGILYGLCGGFCGCKAETACKPMEGVTTRHNNCHWFWSNSWKMVHVMLIDVPFFTIDKVTGAKSWIY